MVYHWRKRKPWVGTFDCASTDHNHIIFPFPFLSNNDITRFWSREELVYGTSSGLQTGLPPAPFAVIYQFSQGMVHWQAVADGMSTAIALGFLYVIRCSVHGAALKKNLPNLSRTVKRSEFPKDDVPRSPTIPRHVGLRTRQFSESVDIEAVMQSTSKVSTSPSPTKALHVIHAQPSNISLKAILTPYGISQFVSALVGGFAITPAVGASSTLFSVSLTIEFCITLSAPSK